MRTVRCMLAAVLCTFFVVSTGIPAVSHDHAVAEGKYSVAGLDNEKEVHAFFLRFRDAVKNREKEKVAGLISYPITASLATGRRVKISTAKAFVKRYDSIFDSAFTAALSRKNVDELWANSQGVATESGEIWFGGIVTGPSSKHELKILAINGITAR